MIRRPLSRLVDSIAARWRRYQGRRALLRSQFFRGFYRDNVLTQRHRHPEPFLYEVPSGVFAVPSDAGMDLIVHTIARGQVFDEAVVEVARQFLADGNVVLDVGANIGQMTVLFARAVAPGGRVVAFEADPYMADLLRTNIALNRLSNVDVVEAAVWNVGGVSLPYPEPDLTRFGTYGAYGIDPQAPAGRTVRSTTIDALAISDPVCFMKVDIQGSDLFGLQGAVETIRRHQMPILFEYEPLLQSTFGTELSDYFRFIDQIGYEVRQTICGTNYLIAPRTSRT